MTREEVHDLMENELRCVQRGNYCDRDCAKCPLVKDDKELIEAYGYVIKLLGQEPCKDWYDIPSDEMTLEQARQAVKDLRKKLMEYLEQEPKTGHWINIDKTHSKCDRCESVFEIASANGEANYCPHCGAKMVEPQESEG
jgi:hypothetical protein